MTTETPTPTADGNRQKAQEIMRKNLGKQPWNAMHLVGATEKGELRTAWYSSRVLTFEVVVRGIHTGVDGNRYGVAWFKGDWRHVHEITPVVYPPWRGMAVGVWRFGNGERDGFVNGTAYAYSGPSPRQQERQSQERQEIMLFNERARDIMNAWQTMTGYPTDL